jgi:hypothetical protein
MTPMPFAGDGTLNHGNGIWAVKSPLQSPKPKPKFWTDPSYEADDCGGSEVTAGSFEVGNRGKRYKISVVGNSTRWQSLGARQFSRHNVHCDSYWRDNNKWEGTIGGLSTADSGDAGRKHTDVA